MLYNQIIPPKQDYTPVDLCDNYGLENCVPQMATNLRETSLIQLGHTRATKMKLKVFKKMATQFEHSELSLDE